MPKHRQCCAKEDEMVKAQAYAAEKEFKYTFVIHIPCRELQMQINKNWNLNLNAKISSMVNKRKLLSTDFIIYTTFLILH